MGRRFLSARHAGFTLIELLVVVAILVTLLTVLAPSFNRLIVMSRLKSVNSQLLADLQFARAEAASRNMPVYWTYRVTPGVMTCYTIYTTTVDGLECNCTLGPGAACGTGPERVEIKVTQIPMSGSVRLAIASGQDSFAFDNISGGLYYGTTDFSDTTPVDFLIRTHVVGDTSRALNTFISPAGRPTACSAGATSIAGYAACPPPP